MYSLCVICARPNSNYKCPKCRQPYCSVKCNKEHKGGGENASSSCVVVLPKKALTKEDKEELVEGELELEALLATTKDTDTTNNNTLKEKSIKPKPTRTFETDSEDIHRHRLRREHFAKLALNLPLLEKLRSERLLETLKAIDNSAEESEKKGEESALENALKNSDFRKFAEDVLDTITTGKEEIERE
ncbi:Predicted MYND Zn-finger protein/hormone receptor interactor (ISS) [Bathycoccus prasinos]|uniref:Predicted MYND Zn-finger protein/hormone receptor interactor (ISS) n=1 Tax=Bathycoccus prasinos TaxID=41875 RepID=K8F8X0_9CHLO|nr:Predicted MYND Zn-finger protein/hormone receptor interactor (ISS) [Bathycoccus prasinos]CCO18048.1 Predicted MYND Zn-finger protein/hormone receptor interactor (ISS) [Bathycoccus prasinos]|eukprot:XP_007510515.1 Predicted MYND Zn-finger protein/hormone receptor interactor (ISS) [Bathycoccus prasinos]